MASVSPRHPPAARRGREGAGTLDADERAVEHLHAIDQAEKDAQKAVRDADLAYRSEVERAASAGAISELDEKLLAARESLNAAAHPNLHQQRREIAQTLATAAEGAYLDWVDTHALEIAEALAPEAVKIAAEVNKINADVERRLAPLQTKRAELLQTLAFVLGGTPGVTRQDIIDEQSQPITLRPDVLRRLQGVPESQPEVSEPPVAIGATRSLGGSVMV